MLIILAAVLPFFVTWAIWDIKKRISKNKPHADFEKIVRETEARARLELILSMPPKRPELWWGDECVTISEDGSEVIHKSLNKAQPVYYRQYIDGLWGNVEELSSLDALKELTLYIHGSRADDKTGECVLIPEDFLTGYSLTKLARMVRKGSSCSEIGKEINPMNVTKLTPMPTKITHW